MSNTQAAWPEGVIARYITVAGVAIADPELAVEITYTSHSGWLTATCRGCEQDEDTETHGRLDDPPELEAERVEEALPAARTWAQSHAEKCRAMPRPDGAR
ncbi:hypothetical protein ACFYXD_35210 [Streptomyces platensis]|uniref:hypothetical protein n=1 Tax=Streptomyces platensis TaxID=58346 RepID=UPI0036CB48A6